MTKALQGFYEDSSFGVWVLVVGTALSVQFAVSCQSTVRCRKELFGFSEGCDKAEGYSGGYQGTGASEAFMGFLNSS